MGKRLCGLSCTLTKCSSCGQPFKGTSRVAVFPCKHAFHTACLDRAGGLTLSPIGEEVWRCSLCCPCTGTGDRPGIGEKSKGERDMKGGEELKDIKEKNSKETDIEDDSLNDEPANKENEYFKESFETVVNAPIP